MEFAHRINNPRHMLSSLVYLSVSLALVGWLQHTPGGLLGKADAVAYAVCHRIDLRSFHLGDRQLPLCARCTGMYLGAMLGLSFQGSFFRRRIAMPPAKVIVVLGILTAGFGVDGVNSFLHFFPGAPSLYQPQNYLRLITGTGMGLVIAAFLYPAFNQTAWKDWTNKPALESLRGMVVLLFAGAVLDLLVLTENPLLLYPLALISAAGVLVLLTIIYTMVLLMLLRRENLYHSWIELFTILTGGFGLALLQIMTLDFVRYLLTGTWGGFHLG